MFPSGYFGFFILVIFFGVSHFTIFLLHQLKASSKRSVPVGSLTKTQKQDPGKDDGKSGKAVGRTSAISVNDRDVPSHTEGRQGGTTNVSSAITSNGKTVSAPPKCSLE